MIAHGERIAIAKSKGHAGRMARRYGVSVATILKIRSTTIIGSIPITHPNDPRRGR